MRNQQVNMTIADEMSSPINILPTVTVRLGQEKWSMNLSRGLFDCGSQPNLIVNNLIKKLNLKVQSVRTNILGLSCSPIRITRQVTLKVYPWFDSNDFVELTFWVLPKNAKWHPLLPDRIIRPSEIKLSREMTLADPLFWKPENVQLLLGIGACARILEPSLFKVSDGLIEQQTKLGAVVMGNLGDSCATTASHVFSSVKECSSHDIEHLIKRFWEVEELPSVSKKSKEHQLVEKIFTEGYTRDENGRFSVPIPINPEVKEIGDSRPMALKRFHILENRFEREPDYKAAYVKFMREYNIAGPYD